MNLPMLIKLARLRETAPMTDVLDQSQDAGRKYINVASQILTHP
jgi:PTS system mannose-specific IIA component